jgi:hypothetical protein
MAESRSRGRAPRVAISPATTSDPASAPATGLPAITSPAAAPVKAALGGAVHRERHSACDDEPADDAAGRCRQLPRAGGRITAEAGGDGSRA